MVVYFHCPGGLWIIIHWHVDLTLLWHTVVEGASLCICKGFDCTLYEPKTGVVIATAEAKMVDFFKLREKATMSAYAPA